MNDQHVTNFGRNIKFTPCRVYTPRTEEEIRQILKEHAKGTIRVIGSLHSWSDGTATCDVLVDMRHFTKIETRRVAEVSLVTAGAGCPIGDVLEEIGAPRAGLTLPTVGTITRQTVAGAISTATHGSGHPSLSHYVHSLRVAAYDRAGSVVIYHWDRGPELAAARCGLGCTGIILSVTFRCVPEYQVAERVTPHDTLDTVLAAEANNPLQEFAYVPYLWRFVGYHRRACEACVDAWSLWRALLFRVRIYRAYKLVVVDWLFHLTLKIALHLSDGLVAPLFKLTPALSSIATWMTKGRPIVDQSRHALTRKHYLFKHVEMEVFVPRRHIREATELLRWVTTVFAGGEMAGVPDPVRRQLDDVDLLRQLEAHRGTYVHHYPLYFRRVLPDDAMISMTGGAAEPYYAIGVFCYLRQRRRYYEFANFVALALMQLYEARLHWGKYLPMFPEPPVTSRDFEPLYPRLPEFRAQCRQVDPNGVFQNEYTRRILGFGPAPARPVRNRPPGRYLSMTPTSAAGEADAERL